MILLAVELGVHVEKHGEEARRDLILRPPTERPSPSRVHIDRAYIWNEDLQGPSQANIQPLSVPGVVGHIQFLEKGFPDAGKRLRDERVCPVH